MPQPSFRSPIPEHGILPPEAGPDCGAACAGCICLALLQKAPLNLRRQGLRHPEYIYIYICMIYICIIYIYIDRYMYNIYIYVNMNLASQLDSAFDFSYRVPTDDGAPNVNLELLASRKKVVSHGRTPQVQSANPRIPVTCDSLKANM